MSERRPRRRYPSKERINEMIALAEKRGLKVTGFDVSPDGTIHIDTNPSRGSAADQWLDELERGA